jgi:hypothetical protein
MNLEIIIIIFFVNLGLPYVNNFSKNVTQHESIIENKKLCYHGVVLIFYLEIELTM